MEADEANDTKDITIEEANGALGGDVSSSIDLSLEEPSPGIFWTNQYFNISNVSYNLSAALEILLS